MRPFILRIQTVRFQQTILSRVFLERINFGESSETIQIAILYLYKKISLRLS